MGIETRRVDNNQPAPPIPSLPRVDLTIQVGDVELGGSVQNRTWVDRSSGPQNLDAGGGNGREPRVIKRLGAGTPGEDEIDGVRKDSNSQIGLGGSGRDRAVGLNTPTLEQRYPIKSGGMSTADVEKAAAKIDSNNDGQITQDEVDAFSKMARDQGVADIAARDAFRRYEAGATMFASQHGRGINKSYLDGNWNAEMMRGPGATAANVAEVRKTLLSQADAQLAADVIPEVRAASTLSAREANIGAGVLKANGTEDAAFIDKDGDGKISRGDRYIGKSGKNVTSGEVDMVDQIRVAIGVNDTVDSQRTKAQIGFAPLSRANGLPPDKWEYKSNNAANIDDRRVGWELKPGVSASDAVKEFASNPGKFNIDCATAKQLYALNGLREQLGDAEFDKLAKKTGLYIGYGAAERDGAFAKAIRTDVGDKSMSPDNYDAGWMGFAKISVDGRPDLREQMADAGWSGEHFMVTVNDKGEKMVVAHPFGEISAKKFEEAVRTKIADTYGVPKEDVIINFQQPHMFDADKARQKIAAP